MLSWIVVIIAVLAIFNAEKLPALRQMMEEKFKDSVVAAKEGSKVAKSKIKKVKEEIDNKKNAAPEAKESEENTPEEIEESLQFMGSFIKENTEKKEQPAKEKTQAEEKVIELPQEPVDDGKVDLEKRD